MSLVPVLLNQLMDEFRRPSSSMFDDLYDQHFGIGLRNDDILRPLTALSSMPMRHGYLRPWRTLLPEESGISSIKNDKEEFRVNLDVQQFKPEEIKVKVADNFLIVEAKHEERSDQHGFIARQFTRKYKLPEDIDLATLKSSLSTDGVLSLHAPKKSLPEAGIREIPITQTNQPAIRQTSQTDAKKIDVEKMEN